MRVYICDMFNNNVNAVRCLCKVACGTLDQLVRERKKNLGIYIYTVPTLHICVPCNFFYFFFIFYFFFKKNIGVSSVCIYLHHSLLNSSGEPLARVYTFQVPCF